MGYWEKPSFYLRIIFIAVLVIVAFSFSQKEKLYSFSKENIFSKSQYLFPASEKEPSFNDLAIRLIGGAYLKPYSPPFLVSGKTFASFASDQSGRLNIERYIVQKGDTISSLSKKFNISTNTIIWANNLNKNSRLKEGQKLVILPISGVTHIVNPGDTLSYIAHLYKSNVEEIERVNGIEGEKIYAGDILIIPHGVKPARLTRYKYVPLSNSYFICPIPAPCRITQGLHWYNAVDFSNGKCGEPIFAAAAGTVQKVSYNSLAGNYVKIIHSNKVVTFYGHMSKTAVRVGQKVYQGQIIGYIGHTGHTIPAGPRGCHVHFSVRFANNPFAVYKAGTTLSR